MLESATSQIPGHSRPNVVIIYTDDLGYGDLSCYGAEYPTPNIDALANRGVRASSWYSNAPICSPSRAALLTGRHPVSTGITQILPGSRSSPGLGSEQQTLAAMLRGHGYATGMFGKWHLGVTPECRPRAHGFDEFFGFLAGCIDYYSHIFYWGQSGGVDPVHDLWHDDTEVWRNGEYVTDMITDCAVDFIDRNADQPFFCYVPYNAPHYPMHAPLEYLDRFPELPRNRRIMAAMVAAVDDGVGAITETLARHDLLDDTIIVFSSDNGPSTETRNWLDGANQRWDGSSAGNFRGHKGSLLEGGIREPFLMSYPRSLPANVVCEGPAQMTDVVPTVLTLAELPIPETVQGVDTSPMLRGNVSTIHEQLYWWQGDQLAIRDGDWKLILNPCIDLDEVLTDGTFLVHLTTDPGETMNQNDCQPKLTTRLQNDLYSWSRSVDTK